MGDRMSFKLKMESISFSLSKTFIALLLVKGLKPIDKRKKSRQEKIKNQ